MDTMAFALRHFNLEDDFEHFVQLYAEVEAVDQWGDDERTLAQYQKLGFTIARQARIYRFVI